MTKKEAMYVMVGMVVGFSRCDKDYKTACLTEAFGDEYKNYRLGCSNTSGVVQLFDTNDTGDIRSRILEVSAELNYDQIVTLLLEGLAYDMKNKKVK